MNPKAPCRVKVQQLFGDLHMKFVGIACALASLAVAGAVHATDPFYTGNWKFTSAVVAPWADARQRPDGAEQARLMGKTITFKAKEIAGPRPFAYAKPQYKLADYGADMVFQGAFDEMHHSNSNVDPKVLAASLGFAGSKIKTLETGCEIDFHFVDETTAEAGLNDYVYTLKKQ
jgi:hypothetical protein